MSNTQQSAEQIQKLATNAFKKIKEYGLLPIPENYELWFVYCCNSEPSMNTVIDSALKKNKNKISNEECYNIFYEYLSGHREEKTVQVAGDQIQRTIEDVNDVVVSAKKHAQAYGVNLERVNSDLKEDRTKDEIDTLIQNVVDDTKGMIDRNGHLEQMLQNSSRLMEDMRRDLEIARKEAVTDGLTGLANRKGFDQSLDKLVMSVEEDPSNSFTMILLDIDHFKNFNDTFGHQVGDQVLKLVARTLKEGVKGRDVAARYGGEEFAILLPETGLQGGLKVAELLRKEVEKKEVVNRTTGKSIAKITLSAGISEYRGSEKISSLIERADAALYNAKNTGRNKVIASPNEKE